MITAQDYKAWEMKKQYELSHWLLKDAKMTFSKFQTDMMDRHLHNSYETAPDKSQKTSLMVSQYWSGMGHSPQVKFIPIKHFM